MLLLAGIILIIFHQSADIMLWVARVMGAMFLLPAINYLVMVAVRHADASKSADYMGVLPAVGGLCFGLVMIIKPEKFEEILLQLLMGVLLVVLGAFHHLPAAVAWQPEGQGWYYVCPMVVVLCGLLSLLVPSLLRATQQWC